MLVRPFWRRLLEVLFHGKPEAVGDVGGAGTGSWALIAIIAIQKADLLGRSRLDIFHSVRLELRTRLAVPAPE